MKLVKLLTLSLFFTLVGISLGTVGNESYQQPVYAASVKKINGHRISKPRLVFKYSSIVENASFDPTKGVSYYRSAYDKVKISYKSYVNSSKPGKYAVVYHVKDRAGYNFYVTHYVNVRRVYLKRVYNPNETTDSDDGDVYKVSPLGMPFKLTAELNISGANQNGISWSSSNPQVASVSSDGSVTPEKDGVTMISTKFNQQTINTPVLVSEGSNINVASSDNVWSQINYDDEDGISYKQTSTLKQVITDLWFTDGERFIYNKGQFKTPDEQSKETDSLDDDNMYSINSYGGYGYQGTFLKTGAHVILQTQDELGNAHLYVGKYNE
ncbi:Ig-like domain-containing protein [Lentilactobacillus hilgardii]|nr:Ig-like domain-containing protein [Lentilactobacillus hilgardii]MCV3739919.1 Ig-like domain-containing protein [Lentilactobacillus hilgardii]